MTYARRAYGADSASSGDYAAEAAGGYKYHFRYSAGVNNTNSNSQFKLCKLGEIAEMVAGGVDPVANFEASEDRPTQGAAAGSADGAADLIFWKSRGLAQGATIYISWEPGNNTAQWPDVDAFIRAYDAALQGYYHADGLYAGTPTLVHFGQVGIIKHGWIPEGASASVGKAPIDPNYAPPAKTNWDLWFPTKSQVDPALAYLDTLVAGSNLESIVWQDGNKLASGADEDIVLLGGPIGSHLEALGGNIPTPPPPPPTPPAPTPKLWQGYPVPSVIAKGTSNYFGDIDGNAHSLGGVNPSEQNLVRVLQQRLIVCGFVPGHTNPNDGWADGIFNIKGDGSLGGPTSDAVARFQHAYMPGTTFYGQCWWDDWTKLFNL